MALPVDPRCSKSWSSETMNTKLGRSAVALAAGTITVTTDTSVANTDFRKTVGSQALFKVSARSLAGADSWPR